MMSCPSIPHPQRKIQFKMESNKEHSLGAWEPISGEYIYISFSNHSFALRPWVPAPSSHRTWVQLWAPVPKAGQVRSQSQGSHGGSVPGQGSACVRHRRSRIHCAALCAKLYKPIFLSKPTSGSQGRKTFQQNNSTCVKQEPGDPGHSQKKKTCISGSTLFKYLMI